MQRLMAEVAQSPRQLLARAPRPAEAAAIDRISHQRVLQMRQMQTDLVSPAGRKAHAQVAMGTKSLQHPIVRGGGTAIAAHRHAEPVAAVPPEVMTPTQTARYSRETDRAMSSRVSAVCASGVRATIRRPLVSLSSRWMMPARGIEARRGSHPNK